VLGEDNRCSRCDALAPVIDRGGRLVCSACGADRQRLDGTVVVLESEVVRAFERFAWLPWLLGGATAALSGAGLSVAALTAALSDGSFGTAFAVITTMVSLGLGAGGAYATVRAKRRTDSRRRFELEQRILGLAFNHEGVLTAADVSHELRVPLAEADAVLTELAKAGRATLDVGEEGELRYGFPQAKPTRAIRVRVSQPGESETGEHTLRTTRDRLER
jgi:signal transduction histidine kinase